MRFYSSVGVGAMLLALVLELLLQAMPVNSGARMATSSADAPFSRYLPRQNFVYSHGWALTNHRQGTTNREGFVNSRDFDAEKGLLVVGDSYIEAFMLPYQDTLQGRLDVALHGKTYSAAASGNGLADTLALVRHFGPKLHPANIVVYVDPSETRLLVSTPPRGHSGFVRKGDAIVIEHSVYVESRIKQLLIHSALARYVYYNLKLPEWAAARNFWPVISAPAPFLVAEDRAKVLEFYFSAMRAAAADSRVFFLIDGERACVYTGKSNADAVALREASRLFARIASRHGFEVIDMQPLFERHWATHGELMDYLPMDGHWNRVAHQLAADALLERLR